jgi:hypothetical protein
MKYCGVNEAFDNSLKYSMNEYLNVYNKNKKNNNTNNREQEQQEPGTFDNYTDITVQPKSFFTAQGDLTNNGGPYYNNESGTQMTELNDIPKSEQNDTIDDTKSMDSTFSDNSSFLSNITMPRKKVNHGYYVNQFMKEFNDSGTDSTSNNSIMSDMMSDVFAHVKKCKYCKNKINLKMKNIKDDNSTLNNLPSLKTLEGFISADILGYNIKELIIIMLSCIILIFILDLLVKIGKKSG